jgi:hypothetical protein
MHVLFDSVMHGKTISRSVQGLCHDGSKVLRIKPQRTKYYTETDGFKMRSSISSKSSLTDWLVRQLFNDPKSTACRSQWPRGPRHEQSLPARTLGSWVRIPLEAWMSVCVYLCCSVYTGSGLATG